MLPSFTVKILTSEEVVLERQIVSLVVPAYEGYLGVWAHHAPLVTRLVPGKILLTEHEGEPPHRCDVTGGYLEVLQNRATVLADAITTHPAP